jgi:hypothetical protein
LRYLEAGVWRGFFIYYAISSRSYVTDSKPMISSLASLWTILDNMNFSDMGIRFTPLCFRSFNAIVSPRVSFLSLLLYVLLVEGKELRWSG